eukprot:494022_1
MDDKLENPTDEFEDPELIHPGINTNSFPETPAQMTSSYAVVLNTTVHNETAGVITANPNRLWQKRIRIIACAVLVIIMAIIFSNVLSDVFADNQNHNQNETKKVAPFSEQDIDSSPLDITDQREPIEPQSSEMLMAAQDDDLHIDIDYASLIKSTQVLSSSDSDEKAKEKAFFDIFISIGEVASIFAPDAAPVFQVLKAVSSSVFGTETGNNQGFVAKQWLAFVFDEIFNKKDMNSIKRQLVDLSVSTDEIIDMKGTDLQKIKELYTNSYLLTKKFIVDHEGVADAIFEALNNANLDVVDTAIKQLHQFVQVMQFKRIAFTNVANVIGDDRSKYDRFGGVGSNRKDIKTNIYNSEKRLFQMFKFLVEPSHDQTKLIAAFYSGPDPTNTIKFLEDLFGVKTVDPMDKIGDGEFKFYLGYKEKRDAYFGYNLEKDDHMVDIGPFKFPEVPPKQPEYHMKVYVSTAAKSTDRNILKLTPIHRGLYWIDNRAKKRYGVTGKRYGTTEDMKVAIFDIGGVFRIAHANDPHKYECLYNNGGNIDWKMSNTGFRGYWVAEKVKK